MDIRNVTNHGAVERGGDRGPRTKQVRDGAVLIPVRDEARISAGSRAAATAVDSLAERARRDDGDREAIVAQALEKLQSGALDDAGTYRATAQRLLAQNFVAE